MITSRLGFVIENKEGTEILSSPQQKWIKKEPLFDEGQYHQIINCIIPTMVGVEETIAWYEKYESEQRGRYVMMNSGDFAIKYIKVTFEDIGEVT